MEIAMDTDKKPQEKTDGSKDIGDMVGDLVVSGATVLAHSAATAIVKRVKKAATKSAPVKAAAKAVSKARKSAAARKTGKRKKASKKSRSTGTEKKAVKKSAKKSRR
jgi:hypothetical protein